MAWTDLSFPFGSLLTSTQITQLFNNFEAMAQGASGAPRLLGTDNWYRFTGADSSFIVNSDTTLGSGIYHYTEFQVNSGKTVTVASGGNLILSCSSQFVLDGTINMSGIGASGGVAGGVGDLGGGGSGGGGGGLNSAQGGNATYFCITASGGGAGGVAVSGGNGATNPVSRSAFGNIGFDASVDRRGAGGGGGESTGSGIGGDGGGAIVIASPSVTVNSLGVVDCSGADGVSGGVDGGGGGGGGGFIQIITSAESYTNTGSLNIIGGTGGTGGPEIGGDGGTGITEIIQLT